MAFGSFGGGGGFGQPSTSTPGGFGSLGNNQNTPFGATSTPASGFGTSGFGGGGGGGGFGTATGVSTGFGAATGFGTPSNQNATSSNLFGTTANAGGFGAANTGGGGGFFGGAQKTGFGAPASGGGFGNTAAPASSPFGISSSNSFGAAPKTTGFSSFGTPSASGGFGTSNNTNTFQPFIAKEGLSNVAVMTQINTSDPATIQLNNVEERLKYMAENNQTLPPQATYAGNNAQQTGGFGASTTTTTGFGSFGAPSAAGGFGSGFGASNPTNQTTGGFGAAPTNTASTPFGQPQPAATGFNAFGTATNAANPTQPTGGFGSGFGNTGGGFGLNNATTNPTGFGAPSTAANGILGGTSTAAPATGFGAATATTNAFGTNTNPLGGQTGGTGLFSGLGGTFGAQTNAAGSTEPKPSGTLFGSAQPGAPQPSTFGSATTAANPTPSLFGTAGTATNTSGLPAGGLFGSAAPNAGQSNNMFGTNPTTTAPKPFGGATSLFGNATNTNPATTTAPAATSNIFGTANNTAPGGLFGAGAAAAPKPGGLFGLAPAGNTGLTNTGLSLGQSTTGLGTQTNAFSQMANNSITNQAGTAAQLNSSIQTGSVNGLTASLIDNPYGNSQLFSSLHVPENSRIGPLATPVHKPSGARKLAPLSHHRLNPLGSRLTPQKTQSQSLGMSYSPFSMSSTVNSSPLMRSVGPSGSRAGFGMKSYSSGNLRGHSGIFTSDALDTSTFRGSSIRSLTIRPDPRRNLFAPPDSPALQTPLNKKVQFDVIPGGSRSDSLVPSPSTSLSDGNRVDPSDDSNSPVDHSRRWPHSPASSEIAISPRQAGETAEEAALRVENARRAARMEDMKPGKVWSKPSIADLKAMSKQQLKNVKNFVVGRQYHGKVEFGDVDLSTTDLDRILDDIVIFNPIRHISVYGGKWEAIKPAVGEPGLNKPSTLHIHNAWPTRLRGAQLSGAKMDRWLHSYTNYLKTRIPDTEFVSYDVAEGTWTFKVQHFSTYGLDAGHFESTSMLDSLMSGDEDDGDIFVPKIPGGWDAPVTSREITSSAPVTAPAPSLAPPVAPKEMTTPVPANKSMIVPRSILKPGPSFETPSKRVMLDRGWTDRLQMSVSPRKRDRTLLRQSQAQILAGGAPTPARDLQRSTMLPPATARPMLTSIDLMRSIYNPAPAAPTGQLFEWPYPKKQKTIHGLGGDDADGDARRRIKPVWNADGTLIYQTNRVAPLPGFDVVADPLLNHGANVMFVKVQESFTPHTDALRVLEEQTDFSVRDGVPRAVTRNNAEFACYREIRSITSSSSRQAVWQLCAILFDSLLAPNVMPDPNFDEEYARVQLLEEFWKNLVADDVARALKSARSAEERAFVYLTGGEVAKAVETLHTAGNSVLALLVTNIGHDRTFREHCVQQIDAWTNRKFVSEFPDPIRAIYALLCGQTSVVPGKSDVGHENRAAPIPISDRFKLDWRRAFGLRLWYGIGADEPVEAAVKMFVDDVDAGTESTDPKSASGLDDGRVDVLWGLLRLFASSRGKASPGLSFIGPETSESGLLDDYRLGFQLSQLLRARFGTNPAVDGLDSVADEMAYNYHKQLLLMSDSGRTGMFGSDPSSSSTSSSPWMLALIPLLHLRQNPNREEAIRFLLGRFAGSLPDDKSDPLFDRLTEVFKIPDRWIFAAKSEFAASVLDDPAKQADWLLRAQMWAKAHDVLRTAVGPRAVIDGDIADLKVLLERFDKAGAPKVVVGWKDGGAIFDDFVTLIELTVRRRYMATQSFAASMSSSMSAPSSSTIPFDPAQTVRAYRDCVIRLAQALADVAAREKVGHWSVLERAALYQISHLVGAAIEADDRLAKVKSVVLRFPLGVDSRLRYAVEMGGRYFERLVGGAEAMA